MEKQQTFASAAWFRKGEVTRRERFLAEMDAVISWARLVELIAPHYPHSGKGRPPHALERMLRIHFLQQWFNLSIGSLNLALDRELPSRDEKIATAKT
jgi:IS5 family transposase